MKLHIYPRGQRENKEDILGTMAEIKWNDRFNLGVEEIDKAHQKLFSIVNKLIAFTENPDKQVHACKEGIKYFKSYAVKHFAEEEAYMKSIAYAKLPMHKSLHDNLRDKTLPALEEELEAQNYSVESVQHFIGICIGWLTGHIMVEDCAIVGMNHNKWVQNATDDKLDALIESTTQGLKALCRSQVQLVSQHYSGENFVSGNPLCYRLTYRSKDDDKLQVHLVFEDSVAIRTLNDILDMDIKRVDRTVIDAMKMLAEQFIDYIDNFFPILTKYTIEKKDVLSFEIFSKLFYKQCPACSLLFNVDDKGYVAMCMDTFNAP